jgi:hypothetical protein
VTVGVSSGFYEQSQGAPKALQAPANLRFGEMVTLVEAFGFRLSRITGGHHIYAHPGIPKLVDLQEVDGKAKAYQVRQF